MKEQIVSIFFAILLFVLGQIFGIEYSILSFALQSISVFIPTFVMWKNTPKHYLKFLSLKKKDIKYTYIIRITTCYKLTPDEFEVIKSTLLSFNDKYKGNTKRIITSRTTELLLSAVFEVDTTIIDLNYDVEDCALLVETNGRLSYNSFINRIKLINDKLIAALSKTEYDNMLACLKIDFSSLEDSDARNPFVKKIFEGFGQKIISIRYIAKGGSQVSITNDSIELLSDSLNSISDDFLNELSLFGHLKFW